MLVITIAAGIVLGFTILRWLDAARSPADRRSEPIRTFVDPGQDVQAALGAFQQHGVEVCAPCYELTAAAGQRSANRGLHAPDEWLRLPKRHRYFCSGACEDKFDRLHGYQ